MIVALWYAFVEFQDFYGVGLKQFRFRFTNHPIDIYLQYITSLQPQDSVNATG